MQAVPGFLLVVALACVAQVAHGAVCDVRCSADGITCFQTKINSEAIAPALLSTLTKFPQCQEAVMSLHSCRDDLKVQTGCCTSSCLDTLAKASEFCLKELYCGMAGVEGASNFMTLFSNTVERCAPRDVSMPAECAPAEVRMLVAETVHVDKAAAGKYGGYGSPPPAKVGTPPPALNATKPPPMAFNVSSPPPVARVSPPPGAGFNGSTSPPPGSAAGGAAASLLAAALGVVASFALMA